MSFWGTKCRKNRIVVERDSDFPSTSGRGLKISLRYYRKLDFWVRVISWHSLRLPSPVFVRLNAFAYKACPLPVVEGKLIKKRTTWKNQIARFSVKVLSPELVGNTAFFPTLQIYSPINLLTYSPMFLFTETNCNVVAAAAAVAVVPFRARRIEVPVVCVDAIVLFTWPNIEGRS